MSDAAAARLREFLDETAQRDLVRVYAAGSVDDGKSTLIGRLLHDTRGLYEDELATLRADSARLGTGPELDFALLTDGLRAEREQGITIDVAYRYFSTPRRGFILADTPGHEQYTRNMATGASTANVGIVLVDARHGVLTQTRRHSFIAALLGIPRLLIAVNKMDLVDYAQDVYEAIVADYRAFAARLGVPDLTFVPISALRGDNVVTRSPRMPWYHGEAVLEYLEDVYVGSDRNLVDLRLPVQYVIRGAGGFRGFCGQVVSGVLRVGDEVAALPGSRTSRVRSITGGDGATGHAFPPMSVTVTLADEIDVSRGDMLVHPRNLPRAQAAFEAMVVWLAEAPMRPDQTYLLRHTTRTTKATIERVEYRVDVNTLSRTPAAPLQLNEIGRVAFRTTHALLLDAYARNRGTGSVILVDPVTNDTVAAGMVIDRVPETHAAAVPGAPPRSAHVRREAGLVTAAERERRLGQRAITLWLTGLSGAGKSTIAQEVERRLHAAGRHAYVLDGDNLRLGLNRDLAFSAADRGENIRRAAEVARLFNDAGIVAIVPVISPVRADREAARRIVGADRFCEVHVHAPLSVCEARDAKGLYRRARAGEIAEFTGVSSPYEAPEHAALVLDTAARSVDECVAELLARITAALAPPPA